MPKKYRMVYAKGERPINRANKRLYRIIALHDGPWGPKGTKGGLIEKESNLSQEGDCWVDFHCYAVNNARVSGNAQVRTVAGLLDEATLTGDAVIYGETMLVHQCHVKGAARIGIQCRIGGKVVVDGANLFGWVFLEGDFTITEDINSPLEPYRRLES